MDDIVVSPEWLAARLDDEDVVVVDVRDAWEFDGIGHVPGAVNVPFDEFRSEAGDEGMLPGADAWRELMSAAGVDAADALVAYDDTNGVFAARFLVTALAYGHRDVHLLDGDYSAWAREHPTTTEATERPRTDYEVRAPVRDPFVDYETVRELVAAASRGEDVGDGEGGGTETEEDAAEAGDGRDVVVLDTREEWEWAEGHLPGAVQLDWREFVDEETRGLRPDDELAAVLAEHGVTPGTRVLLYCNTARRISHTFVVLAHLGYDDVSFYEGSLTDWTARDGPVVRAEDGEGDDGGGDDGSDGGGDDGSDGGGDDGSDGGGDDGSDGGGDDGSDGGEHEADGSE